MKRYKATPPPSLPGMVEDFAATAAETGPSQVRQALKSEIASLARGLEVQPFLA